MINAHVGYEVVPATTGLERLDIRDMSGDWSSVRDLVQHDLCALDQMVLTALPCTRVRAGSNRGGGAHLFVYRAYDPAPGSGIDPVVAGVLIRSSAAGPGDPFLVSGDIAGESRGDVLLEHPSREVIGWLPMNEAARDVAVTLAGRANIIAAALRDGSRQE